MQNLRKPIIAGNWKLNKTIRETVDFVTRLKRLLTDGAAVETVICPPFTSLGEAAELLLGSEIGLGAQNIYWEEKGAFTGEVSATLVKEAGASHVIVGHSERRQYFHETDEMINKKAKAALRCGLKPIICVGETLKEREAEKTFEVIGTQIDGVLKGFNRQELDSSIVAYEPVWAIGTGKVATPAQAQEVHAFIRNRIARAFGEEVSRNIRIQYGGSVKPDNIVELMRQPDIDGALVGGASLDAQGFAEMIKAAGMAAAVR